MMNSLFQQKHIEKMNRGYSLIELVIYIGLFAMLSVVLVQSLITVMRTYAVAARYRALQNNGELVMERITRELRNGSSVTTTACPTTSTSITSTSFDANRMNHWMVFALSGGAVTLAINGANPSAITTSEVSASALGFCSIVTPASTAVKITLTLVTIGNNPVTAQFYSTIILRAQ